MTRTELERGLSEVIATHGPWTAHNIHLGDGVFTLGSDRPYLKLQRLVQTTADVCGRPMAQLRILDLACLEGGFAIEFARHGAEVLAIEGREANLAKAVFAKNALGLDRLTFELGDVRHLSVQRHGTFDVVVCAGILYHLDAPDVFEFIENIGRVCTRLSLVDTSFSLSAARSHTFAGQLYWGRDFPEYEQGESGDQQLSNLWGSLGNQSSFWLTRPSLINLLKNSGFTSVMEVLHPSLPGQLTDRTILAAIKGSRVPILSAPSTTAAPVPDQEEHPRRLHDPMQRSTYRVEKRLTHLIPPAVRKRLKRLLPRHRKADSPWNWSTPWKKRT